MFHELYNRRLMMGIIFIATFASFCFTTGTTIAGTEEDVAKAENLIGETKMHIKAEKRAHNRAIEALAQTQEGRKRLNRCAEMLEELRATVPSTLKKEVNHSSCLTKHWDFSKAYDVLHREFYEEELNKLR